MGIGDNKKGKMPVQYEFQTQNRLSAVTTLLLIALIIRYFCSLVPGRDLNPHSHKPRDFKSLVSTDFTTRLGKVGGAFRSRTGLDGFAIRYITALLTRLYSVCLFRPKPVIHPLRFVPLVGDVEIAYPNHLILK